MKMRIGISSCSKTINEELMRQYAENGIEVMEVAFHKDEYDNADYSYIKKVADDYGIDLFSFHLPFSPGELINPANPDEAIAKSTLDIDKRLIEKAAFLGCKTAVIHSCRGPVDSADRPAWIAQAQCTLSTLADFAAPFGIEIAVENQPRNALVGSAADILEILKANDRLRVCFDVNHIMPERENHRNFMKACGDKIITLHISDYDLLDERHWLPGEGKLDWQMIINGLKEISYQGPWLYELGFGTPSTIERPRLLTCADFRKNAEEIFAGKQPSAFGTPVSGLEHWAETL